MDKKYNNVNSDSQAYTFLSKLPLQLTGLQATTAFVAMAKAKRKQQNRKKWRLKLFILTLKFPFLETLLKFKVIAKERFSKVLSLEPWVNTY